MALGGFSGGGGFRTGGATGADDYYSKRFDTYAKYLTGVTSPDVMANLAQSDTLYAGAINSMGGRPTNAYGVSQLIQYAQDREVPAIPVEKIPELKKYLKDRGWVHPDTPINDYWGPSDPFYEIAGHALDWERDHPQSAPQPGTIQSHGIMQWLSDINVSKVFQALVGMGKQTIADIGYVANARPLMNLNPEWKKKYEQQNEILADVNKKIEEKASSGGIYTYRNFMEDYNIKKLDLNLRKNLTLESDDPRLDDPLDEKDWLTKGGAEEVVRHQFQSVSDIEGVLAGLNVATLGIEGSVAKKAIDPALRTLGEQWAKGGAEAAFRVIPDEFTKQMNRSLMNKLVSYSTGKMGWEEGAKMFQTVAKPLWFAKSTAVGGLVTAGLTAGTKVSITARLRGAAESGYIFPNFNPLNLQESQLSKSIGNAPVLGQGIALGPAGDDRFLGNVVDLTGYIWSPTSVLPVKFSSIRNGVMSMVGRNELAPLQQMFKMGRTDLIENLGGDAKASVFMRYLKIQAHLIREANLELGKSGKAVEGDAFRQAKFRASSALKTKGGEGMEAAIRSVTPEEFAKASIQIFADGHGDPVSWGRTHQILRDVEDRGILEAIDAFDAQGAPILDPATGLPSKIPLTQVDDFRSTSGRKGASDVWSPGVRSALEDTGNRIHQATSPQAAATATTSQVLSDDARRMQQSHYVSSKRLRTPLSGDERLIFTRSDKPLSTVQSVDQWYSLNRRLRSIFPELDEALQTGEGKLLKRGSRTFPLDLDLKNAGFSDGEIQGMRQAAYDRAQGLVPVTSVQGVTPGQESLFTGTGRVPTSDADLFLSPEQLAKFHNSVDQQLVELGTRFVDNHPQFRKLLNKSSHIDMSRANRKKIRDYVATLPRAVTINDSNEMQKILSLGYEPAIGSSDIITLRDVGTGDIEQELGQAKRLQGAMDFLGLSDLEPKQKVLQAVMQDHVEAELGEVAARHEQIGIGTATGKNATGRAVHDELKDIARKAEERRSKFTVNGRPAWKGGQIFDLRSLTIREIMEFGNVPKNSSGKAYALAIQGAIRRGYAYGGVADIRHPLQTLKAASEMFMIRGLPGIEDLLRTLGTNGGWDDRKIAGILPSILRLPDKVARARDFAQFALNPIFTLQNAAETMQMRAFHGVPHTMPWKAEQYVADFASTNPDRYAEIMHGVFGDARGSYYTAHGHDDLYQLVDRGFFGLNLRANEMADAIKLAERGDDLSGIARKIDRIYRYGPALQSPFMRSLNYVFFPFSFNMKYATAAVGWFNQKPTRALAVHTAMAAWNHLNETGALKDWQEQHAPILKELNRLNSLSQGLGFTGSPIGGRNKRVYDAWQAAKTVLSGLGVGAAPFIPMAVSEEDRKDAASVIRRAVPMFKQAQDFWKSAVSQVHAVTQGGGDEWQVSNYMEDKRALDDEINDDMLSIGLVSGRASIGTKAMVQAYGGLENAQQYTRWVQEQERELAQKYPEGQRFSNTYIADSTKKSQELSTLAEQTYKTPAENAILYFAAEKAREEEFAEIAARQHTMSRKQLTNLKIEVAASAAKGLPVADIPGKLTAAQVEGLRSEAVRLTAAYPEFQWLYDRYFHNELGPISVKLLAEQPS